VNTNTQASGNKCRESLTNANITIASCDFGLSQWRAEGLFTVDDLLARIRSAGGIYRA
jgi:hypothetical protein